MGAKQSKRSVDISGKEAEGASEVAAAGAGGEGRMEPLADVDALKPQANGEAHIHEETEKEKQLDSGTPENEKDATTEKDNKEQENDKEKEVSALTNGDGEPKENGDSAPTPEDGKKPKKEKVKKKWSLRSISFSRKDKPKQDKKVKDDEPKTNGDAEKVSEEGTEVATPETVKESPEEAKSETVEIKEDKTPETPVTEPLTNGSSTPETPKVESPAVEEPVSPKEAAPAPEPEKIETKVEPEPEKLPINGLSLEDSSEPPSQTEESKPSEPVPETKETVPVPEIPVKIEVCVEQKPVESPPPPLPANPPPSSAASFAASTMAQELDASLLNNTETLPILHAAGDNVTEKTPNQLNIESDLPSKVTNDEKSSEQEQTEASVTDLNTVPTETGLPTEETSQVTIPNIDVKKEAVFPELDIKKGVPIKDLQTDISVEETHIEVNNLKETVQATIPAQVVNELSESKVDVILLDEPLENTKPTEEDTPLDTIGPNAEQVTEVMETKSTVILKQQSGTIEVNLSSNTLVNSGNELPITETTPNNIKEHDKEVSHVLVEPTSELKDNDLVSDLPPLPSDAEDLDQEIPPMPEDNEISNPESAMDSQDSSEDLPPPPPPLDDNDLINETVVSIHDAPTDDKIDETEASQISDTVPQESIKTNGIENGMTNGNITEQENLKNKSKDVLGKVPACNEPSSPEQPAASPTQESLTVSDKIADLIPEVPAIPDLNTDTETAIAVDN